MSIKGLENISVEQLSQEIRQGGKFVHFSYCISLLLITFRRSSSVYYVRPGESAIVKGMPYSALSLIAGWWGFPWGPIFTVTSLVTNLGGGKDVTMQIMNSLDGKPANTTLI